MGRRDGKGGPAMSDAGRVVDAGEVLTSYLHSEGRQPLFLLGGSLEILRSFPPGCIDCCMTSPPYWGQRAYSGGGIGLEPHYSQYVQHLLEIFAEVKRALKPSGSLWLNIGDAYEKKCLLGLPWRGGVAVAERQGWVRRN